jgi:quercetin dioxygenase-like cupin family protein
VASTVVETGYRHVRMTELRCTDLDASVAEHEALGFRIEMVVPADDPEAIEMSRGDTRIRLVRDAPARIPDGAWHSGRAGMEYRDLIPDRLGGRLIASHIRIRDGGPVPDYVHFHAIAFQFIYVRARWVRVVYEDQGAPFVMHAGDCVVQPPGIRHRVLEASPGLEVIELASPARHSTLADHALALPTARHHPECDFNGQRFSFHRADRIAIEDLGVGAATNGLVTARVLRGGSAPVAHGTRFGFVLAGHNAGDAFVAPADQPLDLTDDVELLDVLIG